MTTLAMKPEALLDAARDLLDRPTPGTAGLWPRAAALLARQAIESALDDAWATVEPGLESVSARAQLVCLPEYIDPGLARRISHAWWSLTRATHHHAYDLAPTATELVTWIADVRDLVDRIKEAEHP